MVLYPNKLPESERVCSGICTSVWAEKGCWNWVLKDAVLFDKPIMNVKGKLSFWEFSCFFFLLFLF